MEGSSIVEAVKLGSSRLNLVVEGLFVALIVGVVGYASYIAFVNVRLRNQEQGVIVVNC